MKENLIVQRLTMATDIAPIAEKHWRTVRLFHDATFNTIIQLICLGNAIAAEPIPFRDFREVIVCALKMACEITAVAEKHLVAWLFKNATFATIVEFVVFVEDFYIICAAVEGGRGVHYGIQCLELCLLVRPRFAVDIFLVFSKILLRLEDHATPSAGMHSTNTILHMIKPATFAVKDLLAAGTRSAFRYIYR